MEVVIALVSFVIGAITVAMIIKKFSEREPVGFLYIKDSELFLELSKPVEEAIVGKKYVTMKVESLDSSQK
jgi:hypothetical protein